MTAGLLILVNSRYNNHLTLNPTMSHFKAVYKKYSNFSVETIKESIDKKYIEKSSSSKIKLEIPTHGDLLSAIYLNYKLPSIYSGKYGDTNYNYNFKWIKNIGTNIIKEAELLLDGNSIDKLYYEWMNVYYELYLTNESKELFDKMTGNLPELYEPENSKSQNGQYPHITTNNQYSGFNVDKIGNIDLDSTSKFPSILGNKYRIKLPFWFSNKSYLALPLVSMPYSKLEIELTLAPIYDLYTVLDVTDTNDSFRKRVKCNSTNDSVLGIQNFIIDSNLVSTDGTTRVLNNNVLDLDLSFELDYIFLDDEERKKFTNYSHEYLIEQHTQINNVTNTVQSNTSSISTNGLTKYILLLPKRSDSKKINNWNNYTSWIDENIPPYSSEYLESEEYYDIEGNSLFYSINNSNHADDYNINNLKQDIIKDVSIEFNGQNIFRKKKESLFFEYQQTFNTFKKNRKRGIHLYSFSIEPLEFQPSGACNFANIENVDVKLNFNVPTFTNVNNSLTFDVSSYLVNYNILIIKSGNAGLKYSL